MDTGSIYIESVRKQFLAYKTQGEKALAQLDENELNHQPAPGSNSISTIVRHMHGNLKSRFTNFLEEDGEKPWRKRDDEFEQGIRLSKEELLRLWEEGWRCLLDTLDGLGTQDLRKTVYIRHEPHTALDAINRQLAHHCSHVGQIILLAKMFRGENWQTLTIARGESKAFNEEMARKRDGAANGDRLSDQK
ncbi:MAG TPA: DUF1572 family protein [Flavihumibacter sp.]|jgi:hypothetical protein